MEDESYVILSDDGFWNGSKWVSEYPDALIFDNYTKAEREFTRIESALVFDKSDDLQLIEGYGYDHERVVLFGGNIE